MRALVVCLALLVGFSTAHAKEADLVKLRGGAPKAAAKPAPAAKKSPTRTKAKAPARKTVAKSKAKPKPKKRSKPQTDEVRLRPMP